MVTGALECRLVSPEWSSGLAALFQSFTSSGTDLNFHPHPLTAEEAVLRANYRGKDLYYVLADGNEALGYGMLRGWDQGYEIPSLGIALHESVRGHGYGGMFMQFLHAAARRRGSKKVRLTVHRQNASAVALYRTLGYQFEEAQGDPLVGYFNLQS